MVDFPADHSMDTTWFAIDADGCVGIFDSGDGGAVPEDLSAVRTDEIELGEELLELLAADSGRLLDRDAIDLDFIRQNMSAEILLAEIDAYKHSYIDGIFLSVTNDETIECLRHQSVIIELYRDNSQIIIYCIYCERAWLKNALQSGVVLAGSKEFVLEYNLDLLGWHHFICLAKYPYPYERTRSPKKPISFKDLSPEIRERLRIVRFENLRFAEHNSIQPIEHMLCNTWGRDKTWMGTDYKFHWEFPDYSIPYSERFPNRK